MATQRDPAIIKSIGLVCATVFFGYLLTLSGTIFSADGARRFRVTQNLVDHGRVDIQVEDRAPIGRDGRQYALSAIGHSLLMVPPYLIGKHLAALMPQRRAEVLEGAASLTNFCVTIVLIGWLVWFARTLGFSEPTSVGLGLIYAFATMAWQQAKDSFEQPQVALYFTAMLYALHRFSKTRRLPTLWLAGLALGLAILTRYTAVLAYGAVAVFLAGLAIQSAPPLRLWRGLGWLMVVGVATAPFVLFDLWFNHLRFGSPVETGYQQMLGPLLNPRGFFRTLWGLTVHWDRGFFLYNPVYLLAIVGFPVFYRQHRLLAITCAILFCSFLGFHALLPEVLWPGGWSWGPRYLMETTPGLLLMCGPVFEALQRKSSRAGILKGCVVLLVGASVFIQAGSVLVNYNRGFTKQALGIHGHSLTAHGPRDSLLYLQAENLYEITRNAWRGHVPRKERVAQFTTIQSLDESMTFGTFQLWWVYALSLGVPRAGVWGWLVLNVVLLGMSLRGLRQRLVSRGG